MEPEVSNMKNKIENKLTWLRNNKLLLLAFILFLTGISLLTYPTIAGWLTAHHQGKLVDTYRHSVSMMDAGRYDEMIAATEQFNHDLITYGQQRWQLPQPLYDQYNSLLTLPPPVNDKNISGVIGYVSIDKINVKLPIFHGTNQKALDLAVCHVAGSSFPSDKPDIHTVITGHRSRVSSRLFRDLDELEIGDEFSITVLNRKYSYEVDQIQVVVPSDLSKLEIEEGKNYCTLVTCTPYGSEKFRMLVRGHLINPYTSFTQYTSYIDSSSVAADAFGGTGSMDNSGSVESSDAADEVLPVEGAEDYDTEKCV